MRPEVGLVGMHLVGRERRNIRTTAFLIRRHLLTEVVFPGVAAGRRGCVRFESGESINLTEQIMSLGYEVAAAENVPTTWPQELALTEIMWDSHYYRVPELIKRFRRIWNLPQTYRPAGAGRIIYKVDFDSTPAPHRGVHRATTGT
jgi:hypothetical protein